MITVFFSQIAPSISENSNTQNSDQLDALIKGYIDYLLNSKLYSVFMSIDTNLCDAQASVLYLHIKGQACMYKKMRREYPVTYRAKDVSALRMPCHTINTIFETPTDAIWMMSVHRTLNINMTIYDSFMPFSDNCKKHFIAFYDGNTKSSKALILQLCGHIQMESMYSSTSDAILMTSLKSHVTIHTVHVFAGYQVNDKTNAYRLTGNRIDIPPSIMSNIIPSFMVYEYDSMYYVWYISTDISFAKHQETTMLNHYEYTCQQKRNEKMISSYVSHLKLVIHHYICSSKTSYIAVQKGLLPSRWIIDSHEYDKFVLCSDNSSGFENVTLNSHFHHSIHLHAQLPMGHLSLKLIFMNNVHPILSKSIIYDDHDDDNDTVAQRIIQDNDLVYVNNVGYGIINFRYASLHFTQLTTVDKPLTITGANIYSAQIQNKDVKSFGITKGKISFFYHELISFVK